MNSGFAAVYDTVMGDAAAPVIWRNFEDACRRFHIRFQSMADVGCGTGAFLARLHERVDRIYGVDLSPEMLQQARRRLGDGRITWLNQDMRRLQLPAPVDLITCNFCTLNYALTPADVESTLSGFHAHLRPQGHLIADVLLDLGPVQTQGEVVQEIQLPNLKSRWRVRFDAGGRGSVVNMSSVARRPNGSGLQRWSERHVQRWYRKSWLLALLSRIGFKVRALRRCSDLRPPTSEDRWVQLVAGVA